MAQNLPQDCIGVILEYAAGTEPSPIRVLAQSPALVNKKWQAAFQEHEPLWFLAMKIRWPATRMRHMTKAVYKARVDAQNSLFPLQPSNLTEIEDCSFNVRCPMFAEKLKETDQLDQFGNPILYCDICQLNVHVCKTADQVKTNKDLGHCVRFSRTLVKGKVSFVRFAIVTSNEAERAAALQFLAYASHAPGVTRSEGPTELVSATFQPMRTMMKPELYHGSPGQDFEWHLFTLDEAVTLIKNKKHEQFEAFVMGKVVAEKLCALKSKNKFNLTHSPGQLPTKYLDEYLYDETSPQISKLKAKSKVATKFTSKILAEIRRKYDPENASAENVPESDSGGVNPFSESDDPALHKCPPRFRTLLTNLCSGYLEEMMDGDIGIIEEGEF